MAACDKEWGSLKIDEFSVMHTWGITEFYVRFFKSRSYLIGVKYKRDIQINSIGNQCIDTYEERGK